MKALPASLALCLSLMPWGVMAQQTIYLCTTEEGEKNFVSARTPGQQCEVAGVAHDERWRYVTSGANGDMLYVDAQTIRRDLDNVSAWVRYVHMKERNYVNGSPALITLQRETYACNAMTVKIEAASSFSETNRSVDSVTYPYPAPRPIVPGTLMESTWAWLCNN